MDEHVHTDGLWQFHGDGWTLPILVEIREDTACVKIPDIPLLKGQRGVLENALSQITIGGPPGEPIIPMVLLLENAEQSAATDPEAIVVWNLKPIQSDNLPDHELVDEFIGDWLHKSGFEISKASACAIYVSLVTHMMHWLVNRRKPVNLIFGTIHPFQYRKNWKEILLGKAWLRAQEGTFEDQTCYIANNPPTPSDMVQSEMLSYESQRISEHSERRIFRDDICTWTLEFTASEWFHKHSNKAEMSVKRSKKVYYLRHVKQTIEAHRERAMATYRKYLNEIAAKIVQVREFPLENDSYFGKRSGCPSKRRPPFKAFILPPDLAREILEESVASRQERTNGALPEVPGVEHGNGAVRETG